MKKSVAFKFSKEIIEMIDNLAKEKNWSKNAIVEESIKQYYYKEKDSSKSELKSSYIMIGKDNKKFRVLEETIIEIDDYGYPGLGIIKIIANENIDFEEFHYKKGDLIFDNDSKDESLNNINNTILAYQYVPEDD